jgi:glucokinase
MIFAGDMGAINARITFFEVEQQQLRHFHEHVYPTQDHPNLESAVAIIRHRYEKRLREPSGVTA